MTYLTQADTIALAATPTILSGAASYSVSAAPYAYVALTDTATHTLVAAAWANASGMATLTLPSGLVVGGYELTASAQQRRTAFRAVSVIPPSGPYAIATALTPSADMLPGSTVPLTLTVSNPGNDTAHNVAVQLNTPGSTITLDTNVLSFGDIASGATATRTVAATVAPSATDGTTVGVGCITTWNGATTPTEVTLTVTATAPVADLAFGGNATILPGATATVTVTLANNGHAALTGGILAVTSPTSLLTVTPHLGDSVGVAPGASQSRTYTLQADSRLPLGVTVPLGITLTAPTVTVCDTLPIYVGNPVCETFESGTFSLSGWTQGTYPWTIDTTDAAEGSHCARSTAALTHSQTAELSIQRTVAVADSITFFYRVSSEANYDKFHFFIDNDELVTASGVVAWTRAAFAVTPGTHTFRFTYSKDGSVNSNSDCAWIDNVCMPALRNDVHFASVDLCQGDIRVVSGDTIGLAVGSFAAVSGDTLVEYTVHPAYSGITEMAACDSMVWGDTVYTTDFSYTTSSTTVYGCDSTGIFNVHINHSAHDTVAATTQANNYHWHGATYTESGEYSITLTTTAGCDSVVTLLLTFDHPQNGIEGAEGTTLTAYPTPTTGLVTFNVVAATAEVYDPSGRLVMRREHVGSIDLGALAQGIYLLRLATNDGGMATVRIALTH